MKVTWDSLTLPCWGQPSQAPRAGATDSRYFPSYSKERQCSENRAWFSKRTGLPSVRGSVAQGLCTRAPPPMARAGAHVDQGPGPPSSGRDQPLSPGPPRDFVHGCRGTTVPAPGRGRKGRRTPQPGLLVCKRQLPKRGRLLKITLKCLPKPLAQPVQPAAKGQSSWPPPKVNVFMPR